MEISGTTKVTVVRNSIGKQWFNSKACFLLSCITNNIINLHGYEILSGDGDLKKNHLFLFSFIANMRLVVMCNSE